MSPRHGRLCDALRAGAVICAAICAVTLSWVRSEAARASDTEQSVLMDDDQLIYATPSHVAKALRGMHALGIDRVKVSLVWALVAPNADSTRRPTFDASDPNAYPTGAWDRYDLVVQLARQLGIGVYFQLTAPAPDWAVARGRPTQGYPWSQRPNQRDFQQFAQAAGTRYSGSFMPPTAGDTPGSPGISLPGVGGVTVGGSGSGSTPSPTPPIPRVSYWGIWNEPNEGAWLNPQFRVAHHRQVLIAPLLYRRLVDAGFAGLRAAGHGSDTVLIGETASGGWIKPGPFVRALYCVSSGYRRLRGQAASALGCPTSGSARAFVAAHPGLFASSGFAHHPYSFDQAPNVQFSNRSIITLANLGVFERGLDRIFRTYGRATGFPLYLTEWGYKTDPPNPFVHTSLDQQATFINQGEYMSWRDPRIRALAQFLLVDDLPRASAARGTRAYWSTFQTGLMYSNGSLKPSYAAFRVPIWLPSARHGARVTIWGQLRPADHASLQYALISYRRRGSRSWSPLREVQTGNPEGYLVAHVGIPGPGAVRLEWLDPVSGDVDYSRTVTVR